ncbi:protein split ends-like [Pectinophora gossypiella]|nr:protein split ends-like [Pectinophora gossypiella]
MVRETRHLWVGNLPDNIREDRIREHFKRYGRVQNVKLLGRTENATTGPNGVAVSGVCATVAFMDIKSASKAHNAEHVLDERTLTTEYYEPAAIPSAAGAPSAGSSPAGSGYSGSSSSVNSATVPAPNPATVSRYHLSGGEEGAGTCALAATAAAPANWRGTNDSASEYCRRGNTPAAYGRYQRNNSNAPYSTPPSNVERTTPHHRWYGSGERSERAERGAGGCSTPSTPGGGTEAGAAPRRRRRSGSGSSRSDSSSAEPSDASRASTPAAAPPHPPPLPHAARTPPTNHHQWSSTTSGRPLAICVRNLPTRSTDSSLKDGLYHEYKKHGKVVWVKVVGQNADRYAVVRFKKPSDVEKALEVSQDKLFFGCKISVAPHQSCDEDAESAKPYETDIDEYHPKATRTLFIGNLEKDVTQQQLREKFKHFGRIIEIDIKKGSGGGSGYAFCQYASISSVVEAIRAMDGEYVGGSRVKLGFGKPVATTCVWVDGLTEHTEKQVLSCISRCGAATSVCVDRAAGAALIHFEQAGAAGAAVRELRRVAAHASANDPERPRLAVDYASRECQDAFYEQLEKHGGSAALSGSERLTGEITPRYIPSTRHDTIRFDSCSSRSRASSYGRGSSRTPRYSSLEHFDPADYAAERRYRVYEELGSSPQTEETPYEDRLQSVVVSPHRARRHRRDSSPEDRKHSKERHRGTAAALLRRSRSGSRGATVTTGVERHGSRRRHRRRRDGSGSRGSRAGTPLRDEPDAPPSEPRRAPPPRPPLPMSLPLPKFAAQLLRAAPAAPRPAPAPAPDSPPRPPSASSSSAGSAPHSPSLEERIRSLDEKYEKWSGSRVAPEAPDRTRLRHRLLEVDINEVKPSEVVRSLLAKRSVFDEDSERLEGATRAPSPGGSPRARAPACVPRALRYPFPAHPSPGAPHTPPTPPTPHTPSSSQPPPPPEPDSDASDRPSDPRLNRPEKPFQLERLGKFHESDYRLESRIRLRTPSTDKPQMDVNDRRQSPKTEREKSEFDRDPRRENERRRRDSFYSGREGERRLSLDTSEKDIKEAIEKIDPDFQKRERRSSLAQEKIHCGDSSPQFGNSNEKSFSSINISSSKSELSDIKKETTESSLGSGSDENDSRSEDMLSLQSDKKPEPVKEQSIEKEPSSSDESSVKSDISKPDLPKANDLSHFHIDNKLDHTSFHNKSDSDNCKEILIQNHINKELHDFEVQHIHLNAINSIKTCKEVSELGQELLKSHDKNGKERFNQSIILEAFHNTKLEKENIEFDKACDKERYGNNAMFLTEKKPEIDKTAEDRSKHDREKLKHGKDRSERHDHDRDKSKSNKTERLLEKLEKEKRPRDEICDKIKIEKDSDKSHKEKSDREADKIKHTDEKSSRHEHHRKDKNEKDKRKDNDDKDSSKAKKEDKHKHDKSKKDGESKREGKNDSTKIRKSSRDESTKDLCRKDSTDSTTSRASHDSVKLKDFDQVEIKEEKSKVNKYYNDLFIKQETEKDISTKDHVKPEGTIKMTEGALKIKTEIKEEKDLSDQVTKSKTITSLDHTPKCKPEVLEKQRHYSVDSPNLECKRKERLNSSSSLPSNIGHKRRMSSQDSLDSFNEDLKKCRNEPKIPERRDSKDSRNTDRHKTTKFNKGHFAKIIESKTKDDKKNQVKPPDDFPVLKDVDSKDQRKSKKGVHGDTEERGNSSNEHHPEGLQNDLDFLATLELRSSEEDERQKALRKEMKEKKRIQQLQQIQELQMQQDALQHAELMGKLKDDKKNKMDDKKKEAVREKRMSTDRKSRDEKSDNSRRKSRKQLQSTDTSDSDEPKKHSIFDIVDDEPTYISMYDKVKARSCKNMQKQEEEKRQEKIKAKFSQLKQSRAKREEKKRSSWDEDSDSDPDRSKPQKISMDSSSDDEQIVIHNKKREKSHGSSLDYDMKSNDYYNITSNEEDSRNKLSRKNSRTRIISDTSDDDGSKRSISKSPNFINEIRKEFMSNFDSLQKGKDDDVASKLDSSDKVKKNSLLNLFGKSDSEDSKTKASSENNDTKPGFMKTISNDFSSESESTMPNRIPGEIRKKHKKKQKKHKLSISDDESKVESSDAVPPEGDSKHKNSEKFRRHSNKKDKRKDKIRDSIDLEDSRDDKIRMKKDKKFGSNSFDSLVEQSNNNKKEGKMEDIFGPLSDESDRELEHRNNKSEFAAHDYDSTFSDQMRTNNEDSKIKEKDENRRRRDKKRKERRPLIKDDDNSLDVDAVSKAIEARLFADSMNDDDSRSKIETPSESLSKPQLYTDSDLNIDSAKDKLAEKVRRDNKEKKKKKKKNREERQNRKDHHQSSHSDRFDYLSCGRNSEEMSPKTMLLDIPLPTEAPAINLSEKSDDSKSLSESPSLPRLTDSPPVQGSHNLDDKRKDSDASDRHGSDHDMDVEYVTESTIEVTDIPMPPPIVDNIIQDLSEVPLPSDPVPIKSENIKSEKFLTSFGRDIDVSEDAVRSISNSEKEIKIEPVDKIDAQPGKDKKVEEKPRAIISQEETEDAVAALLGESFGGKESTFPNCYEEVETSTTHEIETESSTIEPEVIPEEDAEEMRQAVQNLNASEMEMKPDTPLSDNDLLLIDTDSEAETSQDAIERLPVNVIATNQSRNGNAEQSKPEAPSNIITKPVTSQAPTITETTEPIVKTIEPEIKSPPPKRDILQQVTSTATPVITSWTLSNNKILEPHVVNVQSNQLQNRETNDNKPTHITANIVQIKAPQNQTIATPLRPIIAPNRVSAPYQVINHMIRPQASNMQPPTIKIPEPHIIYQKPPSIVISPRMASDPRQQSPKTSPQGEGMTSPRLTNMILSTSPQNMNSVGIVSPNAIQQRSPGQVTVVRMQQPPLSPIQSMHIPPGTRTMVSPSRPNSVLVQTQGGPIHFNRLPVTPVLAPISKQIGVNNIVQQNKTIAVSASPIIHQQKVITGDSRKPDQRNIPDNLNENSKIILSPTSLQHSTNPTVLAQNRLISMQNVLHSGNANSPLHLTNKVLINNMSHLGEKRENLIPKSEQHNHLPFNTAPIIHVANVNHSTPSIMQTTSKPVVCTLQEASTISRGQNTNVIHSLNSQRLLTTAPISSVIQLDASKSSPSVLSMAAIRSPTVLTKLESSTSVAVTTTSLTNVVMTPLLLKTSNTPGTIRLSTKSETEKIDATAKLQNSIPPHDNKFDAIVNSAKTPVSLISDKQKDILMTSSDSVAKCETDFEELLKDNTNEIKVTNDPEKKLEVNVGKTVTLISAATQRKKSVEIFKEELPSVINQIPKETVKENKELVSNNKVDHETKAIKDESINVKPEPEVAKKEDNSATNKEVTPDTVFNKVAAEEQKPAEFKDTENVNTFFKLTPKQGDSNDSQLKGLDENDSWSAKDVNIESVIKKVDSLCNDSLETDKKEDDNLVSSKANESVPTSEPMDISHEASKSSEVQSESDNFMDDSHSEESSLEKTTPTSKRGGRGMRGKKIEKNQDRVQTRQISKPARGATSARRGRGRAKVDKKIKSLVNHTANNMPGDVYDFHEDSGDETSTSPNKNETRPRLILTIKSPLSGQSNAVATSTLSITPKEQQLKNAEKVNKEEKVEDFISPSANTRKSRRLQEKDVQRSTVDDVIEDVVKGNAVQTKVGNKELNKKRQTRQTGANKVNPDKTAGNDTRKSPRGVKRTRDRSLSDASVDSSDEKVVKRDEAPKESKVPKIVEPPPVSKPELESPQPAKNTAPVVSVAAPSIPTPSIPTPTPTPIMKPPKKMISEISAKLASAFEAAAAAPPVRPQPPVERLPLEAEKRPNPIREPVTVTPVVSDHPAAATGDVRGSVPAGRIAESAVGGGEAAGVRRPEAAAGGVASGAGDARGHSPALPHRLPERAAPLLLRAAADEYGARPRDLASLPPAAGAAGAVGAVGAVGAAGAAHAARGYAGAASLPRGAHQPPAHAHSLPPPAAPHALHPQHPQHPHAKQVAVVGPHHHHQVPGSRVTITSVPTISPQGQMTLGDGMYPHFSHQHYQMYQQHFRATQHESRATPSPYTRSLEAEGCEAPTPPLELRRPPSARVPRPAHSPAPAPAPAPGPADRLIMYAAGCGRSPPPAHGTSRLPSALPPTAAPGPPHASQVPREADSLQMLLRRYPVMWQGLLALKNDSAAVQMHFVGGNPGVAGDTLPRLTDGSTPPLRIAQRMRLEPQQLDQVHRKMKLENEHCMLLALPCGRDHMDVLQQSTNLTAGFITYLQRKQAAGIVNVAPPGHHQAMYTVHIFPSCDFANENLNRIAPDLMHRVADIAHLLIVIATV